MRTFRQVLLFGVILLECAACKNKATEQTKIETDITNDSLQQACGIIIDATMNGFTMVTFPNDTLYISTMDQNIALEGGLLLGDTLDVTYTMAKGEPSINIASTVKKVH